CDKMRCPNPVGDGGAGDRNPDQPRPSSRRDRAMKDADGYNTCNEANQTSEHDKPPIMVFRETGKNAEHRNRSLVNALEHRSDRAFSALIFHNSRLHAYREVNVTSATRSFSGSLCGRGINSRETTRIERARGSIGSDQASPAQVELRIRLRPVIIARIRFSRWR